MLVRGVRSSCEASATKSRWAWIICWVSERAASSSRSISSSVLASSATSSEDSGIGRRREGSRVVAISRAAAVSEEIGRIARPATASPASSARTVPPSTPSPRNSQSSLSVSSIGERLRAYCR